MKATRALSFLLALALLASLVVPGSFVFPAKAEDADNGMQLSKTATKNTDGTYTITLEAYATGSKVISEVKSDVPTDIILVLDQSGSMKNNMKTYSFRPYTDKTNSDYYELRHNGNGSKGNLYYPLGDGGYATVSVVSTVISSTQDYTAYDTGTTNSGYYDNRDNLYAYNAATGEYEEVTLSFQVTWGGPVYTYTFPDDTYTDSGWGASDRSPGDFGGKGPLYYFGTSVEYSYTYSYTDENNELHEIGTSVGNDSTPEFTLYEYYESGTMTRIEALKAAVRTFVSNVNQKAKGKDNILGTEDDVNHRVAVVGFASESGYGDNTELLSIAGSNSGSVGVAYGSITNQNLKGVLQDMNTQAGQNMVQSAINALDTEGATRADLGMDMANRILEENPVPEGKERSRVVVFFTDGAPTTYDGFNKTVANDAISKAATIKGNGAFVYSVGIFEGADATSAGTEPSGNLNQNSSSIPAASNWFMQKVSSNNGTPRSPSYYLSASDSGTLSSIFRQISEQIEDSSTSTTLGEEAVIRDIISPYFQLPEGATTDNITLETYKYLGGDDWEKNSNAMGAEASIDENGNVVVTNFNFSDEWCGSVTENGVVTGYRGNKLVISFKVFPKDGFLGGNDVPTNGEASGVYEDINSSTPIKTFDVPTVNVPIATPEFTVNHKTIYEGNSTEVSGLYTLPDNTGDNAWKAAYVNVTTDSMAVGETVSPTDCTDYTVTVTYQPKTDGTASAQSGGGTANAATGVSAEDTATVHVLHPNVAAAVNDVQKYYGESYTLGDGANGQITLNWEDSNPAHTVIPEVSGTAPYTENDLSLAYSTTQFSEQSGTVPKQDFDVTVTVKKDNDVVNNAVITTTCGVSGSDCEITEMDGKYTVHVNTCQLIISKTDGADGEPYVFTVKKDGDKYSEVTIVGNNSATIVELPVGTYTIQEDTGWSWRYAPSYSENVTLDKDHITGTINCTNSLNKLYWLNGFSNVVKNIFGVKH